MKKLFIKLCILTLTLMIIIPIYGNAINPYSVKHDDQYTYDYFNSILNDISNTMDRMISEDKSYLNQSKKIYSNVESTRDEILLYDSKGIDSPSIYFIDSFYNLSKNFVKLCELNSELRDNLDKNTTESLYNARINAMEINDTLLSMEYSLNEIDNISILKKGNETLRFNTSNIRELMDIYRYAKSKDSIYYMNITNLTGPIIYISNENPILFENVKIYGIGDRGSLELHIDNKTYDIYIINGSFATTHAFNRVGIHKIYATQNNKTSNIIHVKVSKIPVNILVDSKFETYVKNHIVIKGKVIDYYMDCVNGTIYIDNHPLKLVDGNFAISEYSSLECVKNISIVYAGDNIHSPSNKNIIVFFKKYPTSITINVDKYNATVGDAIHLYGEVFGLNKTSKIYVFVNNTPYPIYTKNKFSINISPNSSGIYTVYAFYNGSDVYAHSKSNTVIINVAEDGFNPYTFVWIAILIALLIILYIYRTKYKNKDKNNEESNNLYSKKDNNNDMSPKNEGMEGDNTFGAVNEHINVSMKPPTKIGRAYNTLFDVIIKKYGLSRDTTPRELLNYIKNNNPKIFNDLKYITEIHEKNIYGSINIAKNEMEQFFKLIDKLIDAFIDSEESISNNDSEGTNIKGNKGNNNNNDNAT